MPHDTALVATLAVSLAFAFAGGYLATRLRLPPLVGYLVAGIAVGPFTPGFVADAHLAPQLAEIGVILLMFGVGMHFSVRDLWAVRGIAVPGAVAQIAVAVALGAGLAALWGWTPGAGLVFGLALSVASTVVLLRALEARAMLDSTDGRIAVGWLIVEDLVTVVALVLLPVFAGTLGAPGADPAQAAAGLWETVGLTLAKVAAFVVLMLLVGRRAFPWLLTQVERTGSRELFTLAVIAISLGVAFGSAALFGVSFALGAFFAGVVVHESDLSQRAAGELRPLQELFAALFFVAVGMIFDPRALLALPFHTLGVLAIVLIGKAAAALGIVLLLRRSLHTALTVAAGLAQIGEFSFILVAMGTTLGLLPAEARSLVVAGALFSISLNPLAFYAAHRIGRLQPAREAA